MTILLARLSQLGMIALLLALFIAVGEFADKFGPVLSGAALFTGGAIVLSLIAAFFFSGRDDDVACWRCLYACPAIALAFTVYANTGYRWIEDRAMTFAKAEDRVAALGQHPAPGPSPEWIALVTRDYTIANAQYEYEITIAQLNGGGSTPLPRSATPWLVLACLTFTVIALLPRARIDEVLSYLRASGRTAA